MYKSHTVEHIPAMVPRHLLWYLEGNTRCCWLGPLKLGGTGKIYGLTLYCRTPREVVI